MSDYEFIPDDDSDSEDTYAVNIKAVSEDKKMLPMVRKLAKRIMKDSYCTVGDFLLSLKDREVADIQALSEDMNDLDSTGHVILLAELLALGEGLPRATQEEIGARADLFVMLVAVDSLHRKGLVKAHHANMTLEIDIENDRPIVEKIPGMDYGFDSEREDD